MSFDELDEFLMCDDGLLREKTRPPGIARTTDGKVAEVPDTLVGVTYDSIDCQETRAEILTPAGRRGFLSAAMPMTRFL